MFNLRIIKQFCLILFIVNNCFASSNLSGLSIASEDTDVAPTIIPNQGSYYAYHTQGFDTDDAYIYWSMTNVICKTDLEGNGAVSDVSSTYHSSGPAYYNGKIYIAYWPQAEIEEAEEYHCKIFVRDASDLSLLDTSDEFTVDQGWGAICEYGGKLYVAGGRGATETHEGKLWVVDPDTLTIDTTIELTDIDFYIGIQTIHKIGNYWFLGYYTSIAEEPGIVVLNEDFTLYDTYTDFDQRDFEPSEGIMFLKGRLYASKYDNDSHTAEAICIGSIKNYVPIIGYIHDEDT